MLSNIIDTCNKETVASLALPSCSNKVNGISREVFVKAMVKVVKGCLQETLTPIRVAINDRCEANSYVEDFEKSFHEDI